MSTEITIYHNPACGTSRKTLAAIRAAGFEPRVVEYLKTPPARAELSALLKRAEMTPRDLLRKKEALAADLHLSEAGDDEILDAMMAHPILINRPLVVTSKGVKLCRPAELLAEILP